MFSPDQGSVIALDADLLGVFFSVVFINVDRYIVSVGFVDDY
jgi:hypothetical protein